MQKDTVLYVLNKSIEYLTKKGMANPRLDAEILLGDVLAMERIKLYANFDMILNESEKDQYRQLLKQRATYKPIAYIRQKKEFYQSTFFVDERVLIPRPETEELVEYSLAALTKMSIEHARVLDLATGSGCIGISLALEKPDIHLTLSDLSQQALEVCRQNQQTLLNSPEYTITIHHGDLGEGLPAESFDCIVCNPPYIPEQEKIIIMPDVVHFEPALALFLSSPQEFGHRLLENIFRLCRINASVLIEYHSEWILSLQKQAIHIGFKNVEIIQDLSQKNRFLVMER